jgi:WD40 repeat protein
MVAAVGGDHTVRQWDVRLREAAILTGHTNVVYSLAFSPDGRTLNQRWRQLHRPPVERRRSRPPHGRA